jgi:hypothetical protein
VQIGDLPFERVQHPLTEELRTSVRPFFVGLRRALLAVDVDPMTSALAESYEDDENCEHCVIVSAQGCIYEFEYRYPAEALDQGEISKWNVLPRQWSTLANRSEIIVALRFLGLSMEL